MLPELRKVGVGLTLAHQLRRQIQDDVRGAVLDNVGTLVAFRVGGKRCTCDCNQDAAQKNILDLLGLSNRKFYATLMIDALHLSHSTGRWPLGKYQGNSGKNDDCGPKHGVRVGQLIKYGPTQ